MESEADIPRPILFPDWQIYRQGWGWALRNGPITLLLGIFVWAHWPSTGLWVIGMFIGIDLIFSGWAQVMLASGVRRLSSRLA